MNDHWSATYLARYVKLQHKRSAHNRICAMCPTSEFEIVFSHSSVCLASFQHCQGHLWKDLRKGWYCTVKNGVHWTAVRSIKLIWYDDMMRGACKTNFRPKLGFCPKEGGGGGLTKSQFFKTTTIQNGDFVGILSQYGGGSPVPIKKSPKMS